MQIADADALRRRRARAAAGAGQHGDGRRRHRDLGVEVSTTSSGGRSPASARPIANRADRRFGDGNPATVGDPTFTPLGAPASNLTGPNFTPPFPSYPSGHAGFGGALFQIAAPLLRHATTSPFTFVSDEFNGVTLDHEGNVRPLMPRSSQSLSAGRGRKRPEPHLSRHPLGFDKREGIAQGRRVADYVFDHAFLPVR